MTLIYWIAQIIFHVGGVFFVLSATLLFINFNWLNLILTVLCGCLTCKTHESIKEINTQYALWKYQQSIKRKDKNE